MDNFIKRGYEEGWIKPLEDAFINNPPEEECHKGKINYYVKEEDIRCKIGEVAQENINIYIKMKLNTE